MATQRPILLLGPGDSGRSLSAEQFEEAEFEPRWSYEREEGRLVVMPPDSPEHDLSSEPMRDYLGAYRLAHPELVKLVTSECWVRVDAGTDRIGDIGDREDLGSAGRGDQDSAHLGLPDCAAFSSRCCYCY